MRIFRELVGCALVTWMLAFTGAVYSQPLKISEISDAIAGSPALREHCHPALNGLCFWQPEVFLVGYSKQKKLIATIQLTPENTESGSIAYELRISELTSNATKFEKRFSFGENQPLPHPYVDSDINDISTFWGIKKTQIIRVLRHHGIRSHPIGPYTFIPQTGSTFVPASSAKLTTFIQSYRCNRCTMPIISHAVVGHLQFNDSTFAVVCFLEQGITAGPPVAHVELFNLSPF